MLKHAIMILNACDSELCGYMNKRMARNDEFRRAMPEQLHADIIQLQ